LKNGGRTQPGGPEAGHPRPLAASAASALADAAQAFRGANTPTGIVRGSGRFWRTARSRRAQEGPPTRMPGHRLVRGPRRPLGGWIGCALPALVRRTPARSGLLRLSRRQARATAPRASRRRAQNRGIPRPAQGGRPPRGRVRHQGLFRLRGPRTRPQCPAGTGRAKRRPTGPGAAGSPSPAPRRRLSGMLCLSPGRARKGCSRPGRKTAQRILLMARKRPGTIPRLAPRRPHRNPPRRRHFRRAGQLPAAPRRPRIAPHRQRPSLSVSALLRRHDHPLALPPRLPPRV
jgi:hypothetical protein